MAGRSKDWSVNNQTYLMLSIQQVKNRLLWYTSLHIEKTDKEEIDETLLKDEIKSLVKKMTPLPAIEKLVKELNLSMFEKSILLWCAAMELDKEFVELMAVLHGGSSIMLPDFSVALAVLPNAHWSAVAPEHPLRYWQLIELNKAQLVTKSSLKINERILHYLAGVHQVHERIREVAEPVASSDHMASSQVQLANNIFKIFPAKKEKKLFPLIQLTGSNNADKILIASNVSARLQLTLYVISAEAVPSNTGEATELARLWNLEAALNDYGLLIDCSTIDNSDKSKLHAMISFIKTLHGFVMIDADYLNLHTNRIPLVFEINKPGADEQLLLWKQVSGANGYSEGLELSKLVSQFNMSADTIYKAGSKVFSIKETTRDETYFRKTRQQLWSTCCTHTRPQVDELLQRITPVAGWDDIVLPEEQKNMLREIGAQVKQRSKVYNEWGFASKTSRGLGISALFAGESGTGKTMAAEVLANELQLDLYKIDLSKVVNKYIGETEKNLKRIFDAAEDGGAILLFDEADALFGKRSEVKDSHDRYSNIEVSYLLQRMEAYRGLAILTTNMRAALDKAFLRRLRFIVHFPFPDATQRLEIWKKVFPVHTPTKNLDNEKLSRLSLPGGNIRNIALNAAFFAAGDDDAVTMRHISKAAKAEYEKMEKPLTSLEIKAWQ